MSLEEPRFLRSPVPAPRSSNAVNALIHLHRAEVGRMTTYRRRLDTTTNWAVTSTALVATFAFDRADHTHASLVFLMFIVYFFLHLEARRFRAYEASRYRVRLIENYFYREVLGETVRPDWTNQLFAALKRFYAPATDHFNAMGWRLRSNYGWIYGAILVAWLSKLDVASLPRTDLIQSATLGSIPGWALVIAVTALYAWLVWLAIRARGDEQAGDEEAHARLPARSMEDEDLPVY